MQNLFASVHAATNSPTALLPLFAQLLSLQPLPHPGTQSKPAFYRRIWCPVVTLWYMIWQRLCPQHTLAAVVADACRGGADALRPGDKPLSARLRSNATTGFCKARARLPRRRKVRPVEARAAYYPPQVYPRLRCSRPRPLNGWPNSTHKVSGIGLLICGSLPPLAV